jgi:hypothetical protein
VHLKSNYYYFCLMMSLFFLLSHCKKRHFTLETLSI